jgi:broad specificity phosphatase PhoE
MKALKHVILITLLCISYSTFAQTTTVWIVRHAEKETTGTDPDLSPPGKVRAEALAKELQQQKITAIFTTPYKRTTQTGEAVKKAAGLQAIQTYSPTDLQAFAAKVLNEYRGKSVLIVGHSNTVIPTVVALGATKPFDTLADDDYDMLFKVTIGPDGKATLSVKYYGEKHHSTVLQ